MYRIYGLVRPQSGVTMNAIIPFAKAAFPDAQVTLNGSQITIAKGEWAFDLVDISGPQVLQQSQEIAEKMAGVREDFDVAACDRRIEAWSDTPDPTLDYFENYQKVVGVLKSLDGVIVVDPKEPSFL